METYKKQDLYITPDTYIELHYNANIRSKPYLIRFFSYEGYTEHRLDQNELLNLAESLSDFVFDNPNATGYNDSPTGLHRLWLHRRNEALNQIETLQNKLDEYERNNSNR